MNVWNSYGIIRRGLGSPLDGGSSIYESILDSYKKRFPNWEEHKRLGTGIFRNDAIRINRPNFPLNGGGYKRKLKPWQIKGSEAARERMRKLRMMRRK